MEFKNLRKMKKFIHAGSKGGIAFRSVPQSNRARLQKKCMYVILPRGLWHYTVALGQFARRGCHARRV